jgi:uncharacterized protein
MSGSFWAFVLAGFLAQLVDGSLGMGFGVSANTVLISTGVAPGPASATVHVAKIGTAISSGVSHLRYGNVSWPLVLRLGLPGAVGAFAGATFLSSVEADWIESVVAVVLCGLGVVVVLRATRGDLDGHAVDGRPPYRRRFLASLGLGGGFLDAIGGGGWGPVTTPTLLAGGRIAPRTVVGSVSLAELLVAIAATGGFVAGLGREGADLWMVLALVTGGAVAAPFAARLVGRARPARLGVAVGTLLLVVNIRTLLLSADVAGPARLAVLSLMVAAGAALTWFVGRGPSVVADGRRARGRRGGRVDLSERPTEAIADTGVNWGQ